MPDKRVVIIDALNTYLRNYICNPSLTTNGQPMGGTKGFLGSLQKICRETKPDRIVIVWDGPGGSQRKRAINKDYKLGRKPVRFNRRVKLLSEAEEVENKIWQQTRLIKYLNLMPVTQIMIEGIEADDIIAHVCHRMQGWKKIIVSSDKDFIQLCDQETLLHRPIQKELLSTKSIIEKYDISPCNFAMARAIAGDASDNLPGVPRVGLKTIAKRFPMFKDSIKEVRFEDLYQACVEADSKAKIYENILKYKEKIETNYKMMQLYSPLISPQSKYVINEAVFSSKLQFNKTGIYKMMATDGFGSYDWDPLFLLFRSIVTSEVNSEGPTEICVTCEKDVCQEHPWVEDRQTHQIYPVCSEQCKESYVPLCL